MDYLFIIEYAFIQEKKCSIIIYILQHFEVIDKRILIQNKNTIISCTNHKKKAAINIDKYGNI